MYVWPTISSTISVSPCIDGIAEVGKIRNAKLPMYHRFDVHNPDP